MYIGNVVPEYSRNPLTKEEVQIYLEGGFGPMVYRGDIESLTKNDLRALGFTDAELIDLGILPIVESGKTSQKGMSTSSQPTNNNAGLLLAAGLAALTLLG